MMCVFYRENGEKYFIIFKTYVLVVDMFVLQTQYYNMSLLSFGHLIQNT